MIRLAKIEDLKNIMIVIESARKQLKDAGSTQWNLEDGYPDATTFINDIVVNKVFIYEENNNICGCLVMCDKDESYDEYDIWDNNVKYVALHRMAVHKDHLGKGIAIKLLKHAIKEADCVVRGDTHKNNTAMISLFEKCGFSYKGEIYLKDIIRDNKRNAYEYKVD